MPLTATAGVGHQSSHYSRNTGRHSGKGETASTSSPNSVEPIQNRHIHERHEWEQRKIKLRQNLNKTLKEELFNTLRKEPVAFYRHVS